MEGVAGDVTGGGGGGNREPLLRRALRHDLFHCQALHVAGKVDVRRRWCRIGHLCFLLAGLVECAEVIHEKLLRNAKPAKNR